MHGPEQHENEDQSATIITRNREEIEPLLRRRAACEIVTTASVDEVVSRVLERL